MFYVSFSLKNPKARKPSLIYMYVFANRDRIKISTKQSIHPALWDQKKHVIRRNEKRVDNPESTQMVSMEKIMLISEKLTALRGAVEKYSIKCTVQNKQSSLSELRPILSNIITGRSNGSNIITHVTKFLKVFIEEIESGKRKKPGGVWYSTDTCNNYRNLLQALERFEKDSGFKIKWNDIDSRINNNSIIIYPNPNNGQFKISTAPYDKTIWIEIFNSLGQRVYSATNSDQLKSK